MISLHKICLVSIVALMTMIVVACTDSPPPPPNFVPLSFANQPRIGINVARIAIESDFRSPGVAPHIEHDLSITPDDVVRRWAQDRLKAIGKKGTMRVIIRDASATEKLYPRNEGISAHFKSSLSGEITMSLDVSVQILDERQHVVSDVSVTLHTTQTELDDQKLSDRDRLIYNMIVDLAKSFDSRIEPGIREKLTSWVAY